MAISLSTAIRNARLQVIADAINAGAGAGKLRLYSGSRPATGGAVTTLLAELTLSDPAHSSIAGGVLTFDAITQDASADATGTATWARIVDSDNAFVADLSVGLAGSGADVILDSVSIVATNSVQVAVATITEGAA